MSAKIKASETYMDDVFSSIYSNLILGVKKKKEMSIWGPVDKGENDFTEIYEHELTIENSFENNVNSLLSPNENVIHNLNMVSQHKNASLKANSGVDKRKVFGANDSNGRLKPIPLSYLRSHHLQRSENDIISEIQNLEIVKIRDEDYQEIAVKSSLNNSSSNSRLLSSMKCDNEKNIAIEKRFVESTSSKQEAVSNTSKSATTIHENANPVKLNEKLSYHINKKAYVRTEFDHWCMSRNREYRSRSNLNLSDTQTSAPIDFERQYFTDKKLSVRKDKSKERGTSTISNIPFWKSEACLNGDNCKIDGMHLSKTNLPDENNDLQMKKSSTDFKFISSNMSNQECYAIVNQKKPKIADHMLIDDYTFENNKPISVEVVCDKNNAVDLEIQDHNSHPQMKIAEDVLNTSGVTGINKIFEQKESSKSPEFVSDSEANHKSELRKRHRRKRVCSTNCYPNQYYEQPPRLQNNGTEKHSIELKKQSVSKNKLSNEDSKKKTHQKKENSTISSSSKYIDNSRKNHCSSSKESTRLCIRITNEKCDKDFEFMVDSFAISKIKKTLPKLSENIPDIDLGHKEFCFSADAMNILLRFVFCRSYKFVMPQAAIGVEVLAAAHSWNITEFIKFFQEKFMTVLTPANASVIFSHACHYDLKEICDACKSILPNDTILNTGTPRKRQKICLVSISTFTEPLEISIPFEPIEKDISLSFKKQIDNTFTFKAISGCYVITGLQILLNEKHLVQKEENKNMLEIDYSIKNINGDQVIEGREKKPLRSINIIYFKKNLVLKPKEVGEIFIQTEIEPYFCSTTKEEKITIKNSAAELELRMESNWKVQDPNRKLFFVDKFFYYVRSS